MKLRTVLLEQIDQCLKKYYCVTCVALKEKGFQALTDYILHIDKWFDRMNAG